MNIIVFFVLPLVTILLAIVLQKVLRSPVLVAITFFAIYLLASFILSAFGTVLLANALIATIAYTILAFITAYLVMIVCKIIKKFEKICSTNDNEDEPNRNLNVEGVLSVQDNTENEDNNCCCNNQNNAQQVAVNATVISNQANGGRTGNFRGYYRRFR